MQLRGMLGAVMLLPCVLLGLLPRRDMEENIRMAGDHNTQLDHVKSVSPHHAVRGADRGADGLQDELRGDPEEPMCENQSVSPTRHLAADSAGTTPSSPHRWRLEADNSTTAMLKELEATLLRVWARQTELGVEDKVRYGVCSDPDRQPPAWASSHSVLAKRVSAEQTLTFHIFHPTKEIWDVKAERDRRRVSAHFRFPPSLASRAHRVTPVLLFILWNFTETEGLSISFSSHSLQPHLQTACLSPGTQFVVLTGREVEIGAQSHLLWRITVETKQAGSELPGGFMDAGLGHNTTPISPLLLLISSGDKGTAQSSESSELRVTPVISSSPACLVPSETFLFLCELRKFLSEALLEMELGSVSTHTAFLSLDTLQSLPSVTLGSSASEPLLLGLLNSSAPTLFAFPQQNSELRGHRVKLALQPHLLSILKDRLEEVTAQIVANDVGGRGVRARLRRLQELSVVPDEEETAEVAVDARENQYRALLLLKALQTVLATWEGQRGERAARGGEEDVERGVKCRLYPLTVPVMSPLVSPSALTINNCQGSCSTPVFKGTNHAILLNSYGSQQPLERAPCCVPEEYEDLLVAEMDSNGTLIHFKPNIVAKECGCR